MPCALWMGQTYLYVPFLGTVWRYVTVAFGVPVPKPLPLRLWGTPPVFHFQTTVVPFLTVIFFGEKARPLTPPFFVAPKATADRTRPPLRAATASNVTSFRTGAPFW